MPSRKSENLNIEPYQIGSVYSRPEIARLGGVAPLDNNREWTGIVEFANSVVLFPTLDKSDLPPEHRYVDVFDEDEFKWDSQNKNTQSSPVIVRILSRTTPVLLFCRVRPKNGQLVSPFIYAGRLEAVRAKGQNPVSILFKVVDYQSSPNAALAELYNWRPSGGRRLSSVEVPDDSPPPRKGQGRQIDAKKRAAIEKRAMDTVMEHFERLGFQLRNTSSTQPYDYEAVKGGDFRRIEVKGLTGGLGPVLVTAGEVLSARQGGVRTVLVIVHGIELVEVAPGVFEGQRGTLFQIDNWIPEESRLKPLQFEYQI